MAILASIALLNDGSIRVASKVEGEWVVGPWIKQAISLYIKINDSVLVRGGPQFPHPSAGWGAWFDKVPLKTLGWDAKRFEDADFRTVPGSIIRYGAYLAPKVVVMPSFINIGAYVGENTMVDTWATVGSCAQIGRDCHLSGGVGIGGVLEPIQNNPTIIEDGCFIGARSEVVEGVIVGQGSVLSMGVFLSASTKIVDRATGKIHVGKVPPYSVVVPGTLATSRPGLSTACAVIVKTVDERTRSKTSINELLRE